MSSKEQTISLLEQGIKSKINIKYVLSWNLKHDDLMLTWVSHSSLNVTFLFLPSWRICQIHGNNQPFVDADVKDCFIIPDIEKIQQSKLG